MPGAAPAWQPAHEVELVAGTPAGGGQDRPARALIRVLESQRLVEVPGKLTNIPGHGGGNAWAYLERHAGDAHVIAINSPTIITNKLLGVSAFDHTALTPLANLYTEYIAFWDAVLAAATRSDEWNAELAQHYWASTYLDSGHTAKFLAREHAAMRSALADAGLIT